jgi:hypothetical protein
MGFNVAQTARATPPRSYEEFRENVDARGLAPTSRVQEPSGRNLERSRTVKYVILIHSNPQPWGHPTGDFVAAFQALPEEQRDAATARTLPRRRWRRRSGSGSPTACRRIRERG